MDKITNIKNVLLSKRSKARIIDLNTFLDDNKIFVSCEKLIKDKIDILIFKVNDNSIKHSVEIGRKIRQLCALYDILFIVMSRIDIARILDSEGIILNSNDIQIEDAKRILDKSNLFGYLTYSNHDENNLGFDFVCSKSENNLDFNVNTYI